MRLTHGVVVRRCYCFDLGCVLLRLVLWVCFGLFVCLCLCLLCLIVLCLRLLTVELTFTIRVVCLIGVI